MSVLEKIKIFSQSQNADFGNSTGRATTREPAAAVPGTPGKLDMSKFSNFQTPRKSPATRTPAGTLKVQEEQLPTQVEEPLATVVEAEFVTPYSERMSLTPEDAPVQLATAAGAEGEEDASPGVSVELNHRLRFLKHPPPRSPIH